MAHVFLLFAVSDNAVQRCIFRLSKVPNPRAMALASYVSKGMDGHVQEAHVSTLR